MKEAFATLSALVETILPSDDGPGAAETAAARFVARALERPEWAASGAAARAFLAALDAEARRAAGAPFDALSPSQRNAILKRLLAAEAATHEHAMRLLIDLSVQGFLCHPRHGGNRDRAGWDYLGFRPRF